MFSRLKLKGKLLLFNLVTVLSAITIIAVSQYIQYTNTTSQIETIANETLTTSLESNLHDRAQIMAKFISASLAESMYLDDKQQLQVFLQAFTAIPGINQIILFDKKNIRLFESSPSTSLPSDATTLNDVVASQAIYKGEEYLGRAVVKLSRENTKQLIQSIPQKMIQQLQGHHIDSTVLIMGLTLMILILCVIMTYIIAENLISPIQHLVRHANRIGAGTSSHHTYERRHDEVGELARAFDQVQDNLAKRNAEIEQLAYYDTLTRLPNRPYFLKYIERMTQSATQQQEFALLYLDLDNFKDVNDNLGHTAGDKLITEVGQLIWKHLRGNDLISHNSYLETSDGMIGRIGGDEFLICLPGKIKHYASARVAERILNAISAPIKINDHQMVVGGSIGITHFPENGNTAEEIIRNADIAMYQAKQAGKNTYSFFTQEMQESVNRRAEIERELRYALLDFQQFEVVYQPKISLNDGRITGAEALLRWKHPDQGFISPAEFIPIAEDLGLIIPLGNWILHQVAKQLQEWQAITTSEFHIAVNLSLRQVYQQDTAEQINSILQTYELRAEQLHMEITETFIISNEKSVSKTLTAIRNLGIQIWLDDFGTGYSSLGLLREFNVDGVKIDRSFITDLEHDEQDKALTAAIIAMAGSLGISVVAEGVETDFQLEFLSQHQCPYGQGYYFDKPLSSETFLDHYLAAAEK